ncbi:MAG: hypothetical protein Q4D79_13570 [Propionibacteriaceae bacterium]|nr:hypothetical protein [Propionibacteriaceae bacterium]
MKTMIIRTTLAAVAVASLGLAACQAGVEAAPKDSGGNSGATTPAGEPTSNVQVTEVNEQDRDISVTADSDGVSVGPDGVSVPGVSVGPDGVSAPGVSVGPDGITAPGVTVSDDGISIEVPSDANKGTCVGGKGEVNAMNSIVSFSGHCDVIEVKAAGSTVYADSVGELVIRGMNATVSANQINSVDIKAAGNLVVAGGDIASVTITAMNNSVQAVGAITHVDDRGAGNSITAGR